MFDNLHELLEQTQHASEKDITDNIELDFLRYAITEAMLGNPNQFDFLSAKCFQNTLYGALYAKLEDCHNNGNRPSIGDLKSVVMDTGGQIDIVNMIASQASIGAHMAKAYASEIDESYRKREMKKLLVDLSSKIDLMGFSDATKAVDSLREKMESLVYSPIVSKTEFTHHEAVDTFLEDYLNNQGTIDISTGIKSLDAFTGGIMRSDLIVLGGRPSMGKTALAIFIINNLANQGLNVLNFSLEMTNKQAISRFVAMENEKKMGLNYTDFTKREIIDSHAKVAVSNARTHNNIIHCYAHYDINRIIAFSERKAKDYLRVGKTLDCICIDYLQMIPKEKGMKTENEATSEITAKLKGLAKRLNVAVILLSQLNRDVEKETNIEDKRPNMGHLRNSGAIEQDADVILFPFRPSQYEQTKPQDEREYLQSWFEIFVAKNRQGMVGIAYAECDMAKNIIMDTNLKSGLTKYGNDKKNNKKTKASMRQNEPKIF